MASLSLAPRGGSATASGHAGAGDTIAVPLLGPGSTSVATQADAACSAQTAAALRDVGFPDDVKCARPSRATRGGGGGGGGKLGCLGCLVTSDGADRDGCDVLTHSVVQRLLAVLVPKRAAVVSVVLLAQVIDSVAQSTSSDAVSIIDPATLAHVSAAEVFSRRFIYAVALINFCFAPLLMLSLIVWRHRRRSLPRPVLVAVDQLAADTRSAKFAKSARAQVKVVALGALLVTTGLTVWELGFVLGAGKETALGATRSTIGTLVFMALYVAVAATELADAVALRHLTMAVCARWQAPGGICSSAGEILARQMRADGNHVGAARADHGLAVPSPTAVATAAARASQSALHDFDVLEAVFKRTSKAVGNSAAFVVAVMSAACFVTILALFLEASGDLYVYKASENSGPGHIIGFAVSLWGIAQFVIAMFAIGTANDSHKVLEEALIAAARVGPGSDSGGNPDVATARATILAERRAVLEYVRFRASRLSIRWFGARPTRALARKLLVSAFVTGTTLSLKILLTRPVK